MGEEFDQFTIERRDIVGFAARDEIAFNASVAMLVSGRTDSAAAAAAALNASLDAMFRRNR